MGKCIQVTGLWRIKSKEKKYQIHFIKGNYTVESSITQSTEVDNKAKEKTKITGTKKEKYKEIEDAPPEEKFDGAKVFANVVAGLAVVGLVTIATAAIVVATGGSAAIIAGAALGGTISVGMTAVGDVARGKVSSQKEYAFTAFSGAVTGAISGGISTLKKIGTGAKIALETGEGFITGAGDNIARQMVLENKGLEEVDYKQSAISGIINAGLALAIPGILNLKPVKKYTKQVTKNIQDYKAMQRVSGIIHPGFNPKPIKGVGKEALEESAEKAISRLDKVEVKFKYKSKFDKDEFARQLSNQELGMNELTVDEYLQNRKRYLSEGRSKEGNLAQKFVRKEALSNKIDELRNSGMPLKEAKTKAKEWLNTQAALHDPDQIAGGNPLNVVGMGDRRVNQSIGAQWKNRIDDLDKQIQSMAKNMSEAERKSTYLNVKLQY